MQIHDTVNFYFIRRKEEKFSTTIENNSVIAVNTKIVQIDFIKKKKKNYIVDYYYYYYRLTVFQWFLFRKTHSNNRNNVRTRAFYHNYNLINYSEKYIFFIYDLIWLNEYIAKSI